MKSALIARLYYSFSMLPVIDKPTRVYIYGTSATLIDNIFVNDFEERAFRLIVFANAREHAVPFL